MASRQNAGQAEPREQGDQNPQNRGETEKSYPAEKITDRYSKRANPTFSIIFMGARLARCRDARDKPATEP